MYVPIKSWYSKEKKARFVNRKMYIRKKEKEEGKKRLGPFVWSGLWTQGRRGSGLLGLDLTQGSIALFFPPSAFLHGFHGFRGQLLTEHAFDDVLFTGHPVSDGDQDSAGNVAADGTAQDHGGQGKGPHVVVDTPGAAAQGDLQQGVAVEDDDDGHEETGREGVVGDGFMGFVEGV